MESISRHFLYPLLDPILNRFCFQILSRIHHQIKWLDLESLSMKRILRAANYPNLSGFGLYNVDGERVIQLFSDETLFTCALTANILSLAIDIHTNAEFQTRREDMNVRLFLHIFTAFKNLRHLWMCPSSVWYQAISFRVEPPTISSSNLLELKIYLKDFTDCLYLLDGRFNQLRSLKANIAYV